jgi:hypothetical protein
MTSGSGQVSVDLDALERFSERMRQHIIDLRDQLDRFARDGGQRLSLGTTPGAQQQAVNHESTWREYQSQLVRLCDAYERAWELTELLLQRYRDAGTASDEAVSEAQRRLQAATWTLPEVDR